MRRFLTLAATLAALSVAIFVGPMGTAAAGPYVFGCTPLSYTGFGGSPMAQLNIYNGSAATATLIHKILAGDGTIMNGTLIVPQTSSLAPTKTANFNWTDNLGTVNPSNSTVEASVRVVSDVPVAVSVSLNGTVGITVPCTDLRP